MRFHRILYVAGLLVALTTGACAEKQATSSEKTTITEAPYDPHFDTIPKDFARKYTDSIRSFFYGSLPAANFSGMLLVAKNGRIIFEHYQGFANIPEKLKMGSTTPLHVASISKAVTAVAVLRLVDEGKIKLDTDIRTYLPLIPYSGISVRMLLNHRSGIPYYGYFSDTIWPRNKVMSNSDIVHILHDRQLKLYFPSNTQFSYCNTNYALLALIVEKVTDKAFPTAMKELIFDPLEMTHSFIFEASKLGEKGLSRSYNSKNELQDTTNLDFVYGDKNLYTTARDLLKFDCGTYSDAFLSKKMKAEMFRGYSYENPGKSNYGLGIRMREEPGKLPFFFHTGWWHGNTGCYVSMRPDTVCMVILSNRYTRTVFGINRLSMLFGDYPFGAGEEASVDPAEDKAKRKRKPEKGK